MRRFSVKSMVGISGIVLLALVPAYATPTGTPAAAATPNPNWYNVELIVFRSVDPGAGGLETWPLDPGIPDWNAGQALSPPDSIGPPTPFQALSPVNEQLGDAWTRLKRSKNYEPLLHVSWTQPAMDRSTAPAVRIGVPPSAVPSGTTQPAGQATAVNSTPLQATPVYGDAKLSTTGPYLHFDLDLVLQGPPIQTSLPPAGSVAINTAVLAPPSPTTTPVPPAFQLYRLQQDRRVDGGKLTYFDHPLFGVILLVTPVRRSALAPAPTP
ncbi:MAG: CsiV family protein [Bacillota bacterium]